MKGINDLEYTLIKICERRGKVLQAVESIAFNVLLLNGLANPTTLVAAVANTFFYTPGLTTAFSIGTAAGTPIIRFTTNSGQGSVGNMDMGITNNANALNWINIEFDSMVYAGGITAGGYSMMGTIFKITITP